MSVCLLSSSSFLLETSLLFFLPLNFSRFSKGFGRADLNFEVMTDKSGPNLDSFPLGIVVTELLFFS